MTILFDIEKFKCFNAVTIPINKFTVFCGENSSGKSTIIQALLLYRAAFQAKEASLISVNDDRGLSLGNCENLFHQKDGDQTNTLYFSLRNKSEEDEKSFLELTLPDREPGNIGEGVPRSLKVKSLPNGKFLSDSTKHFFTYLSAERNGPRTSQEEFAREGFVDHTLGIKGEFTAEILHVNQRTKIRAELIYAFRDSIKGADALLSQSVQDWMSYIVGPIEIRVQENGNAPPSLYFKRPNIYSEWVTSPNTGFGISYTLPIIVAGLLAVKDGYLIIDSPEAHLHPAAQTALAKFLAWIASSGVNVIIETHSDHILDGIRLATLTNTLRLAASDCSILNVSRDENDSGQVEHLQILENGSLSRWPKNFFDQQTKNLRGIADAVRSSNG